MSNPRHTGPLGGYGDSVLGGAVNDADLAQARPGIVRHYRLDDGSPAGTFVDQCGNEPLYVYNNDQSAGTFTVTDDPVRGRVATIASGDGGDAFGVGGSGQWAENTTQDLSSLFTAGGSCTFWFNPLKLESTVPDHEELLLQTVMFRSSLGSTAGVYLNSHGINVFAQDSFGGNSVGATLLTNAADGVWHKVRLTWAASPASFTMALDDVVVFESGLYPKVFTESKCQVTIGQNFSGDESWFHIGSGFTVHYLTMAGMVDDIAIYSGVHEGSGYDPTKLKYAAASTAMNFTNYVNATHPVRMSAMYGEGLVADNSVARLTNENIEVLRTGAYAGRATGFYVEALRSLPVATFFATATTTMNFTSSSTKAAVRVYNVSATTSFGVSSSDVSFVGHQRPVSATTALVFSTTTRGYVPQVYNLSATTSMVVGANGTAIDHVPTPYTVSAATTFVLSPSAGNYLARILHLSAASTIALADRGFAPSVYNVSASSGFQLNTSGNGHSSSVYVSASTSMAWTVGATEYNRGAIYVSASSSFLLKPKATEFAYILRYVSAASSMKFNDLARELKCGPVFVSAASAFVVTQALTYTNPGPRFVAATTNLGLTTAPGFTRLAILMVSAQTSLALKTTGSESGAFNASASSNLVVSSAGRQNRGISVSATTALGLVAAPKTGNLKADSATSTFVLTTFANLAKTGTLAGTDLVFTDLAQAVVWIPWRRAGLTLPAGGNLPHS